MDDFQEILKDAKECLNCKNPLCRKGCPVNTNIPSFINKIKEDNLEEAYEILQENNIMSDICSNVCPYEEYCSGHCIKGIKGEPVKISKLEKYVNLWARDNNVKYIYKKEKNNDLKIAIIGSGPAGIECAFELTKKGYKVTIFEKEEQIGGLLTYGIPGFRLPRDITKNLTNRLKNLGIELRTDTEFGKDIDLEDLKNDNYKAVFLALGADIPSVYSLSDEKCEKIYKSNYILKEYNAKRIVENLGDVIVIGGGNVATDSARAAMRMGAKSSTIIYRRDNAKMPARQIELEEAFSDGVKIIYNTRVINADIKNGKINKVNCIKTDSNESKVKDIPNTEFTIKADSIIFAIGLKPDKDLIKSQGLELDENGLIKIDEKSMTNINGVFAGGDLSRGKDRTVCRAVEIGRNAAKNIDEYINSKI